ncbi:MAG: GTPase Era [candidate division NC10 bacterium RIFCSPLOWO2_12_FULL_66_18]|nr:MAG: GTPase Era [candidate division NC10 bacterium RIFCSPLOWO2_12_FULL_66_18]
MDPTNDKAEAAEIAGGAFRAAYVAIIGRPNVGKSTLMNHLLQQKLSIVSPRPQTTWHRILGIRNLPQAQLLFLDTPGMHESDTVFNQSLVRAALRAIADADVILWLIDASQSEDPDDQLILEQLRERKTQTAPVILGLNKVDLVEKPLLLPLIARWQEAYSFAEIVPVSAANGDNVDRLESVLLQHAPVGHPFYPPDDLSDRPERFFIAEIIREQAFALLHQELPYAVAVQVEAVKAREGKDLTDVEATIYVEKGGQKGIVIGAGGQMLKRIGERARPEIEALLETRVFLRLWVKVQEGWRKDVAALRRFGYMEP